jgi:hypothetical protein
MNGHIVFIVTTAIISSLMFFNFSKLPLWLRIVIAVAFFSILSGLSIIDYYNDKGDKQRIDSLITLTNKKADTVFVAINDVKNTLDKIDKKPIPIAKPNTEIHGDNAHVVSGHDNKVGVNGDVNINALKKLSESDKGNIINSIKHLQGLDSVDRETVMVSRESDAGNVIVFKEIQELLINNGYKLKIEVGKFIYSDSFKIDLIRDDDGRIYSRVFIGNL